MSTGKPVARDSDIGAALCKAEMFLAASDDAPAQTQKEQVGNTHPGQPEPLQRMKNRTGKSENSDQIPEDAPIQVLNDAYRQVGNTHPGQPSPLNVSDESS